MTPNNRILSAYTGYTWGIYTPSCGLDCENSPKYTVEVDKDELLLLCKEHKEAVEKELTEMGVPVH
jgi:hypothetical protein